MEIDDWSVSRLLRTAARLNEHYENERLAARGITQATLSQLRVLQRGPITQTTLARSVHIKPQTAGQSLERLEAAGLVQRRRSQADRRVLLAELTAAGWELLFVLDEEEHQTDVSTGMANRSFREALEKVILSLRPGHNLTP